jgi:F-type H+-transporting ATPase subunit b
MDEILHQLGGLLLGSVPTMVLFLLVVVSYRFLVYGPLTRVLKERRARTEGAIEEANQSIAAAAQKAQEYEAKLREARKAVFEARTRRLRQWSEEREAALAAARESTQKKIAGAKLSMDQEVQDARRAIEGSAGELAKEVLRAVLPAEDSASDLALSGSSR